MAAFMDHEAVPGPVECDEVITVPVDREAMPGPVKCDDAMTAQVDHDVVFALCAQSCASL